MTNYETNYDDEDEDDDCLNWLLSNNGIDWDGLNWLLTNNGFDWDFTNDEGLDYKTHLNYEYLPNVTNSGFTLSQLSLMENMALEPTRWKWSSWFNTITIWTPSSLKNAFNDDNYIDFTDTNNKIKEFRNRNISQLKYIKMSINRTKIILKELMEESWHPRRINRYIEFGGDIEDLC
jgi:hypothetical protein